MNPFRKFHPDLHACELEDRLLPVIANLSVIVLTTGGYTLLIPSPGAITYPAGSPGGTSFSTLGFGGTSSLQPGTINGIPGLAVTGTPVSAGGAGATNNVGLGAGTGAGAAATIIVGLGTNDPTNLNIPPVTRNTIANDALVPPPQIGRPSGDGSLTLPEGEIYHGGVPVIAPVPPSSETPVDQASRSPRPSPVDATPIRLRTAPPRVPADVSANYMKALADRLP
jgi:hypothetical protein